MLPQAIMLQLHGYLKYLGLKVSATTINRILRAHGIEPNPDRPVMTTWNEFVKRVRPVKLFWMTVMVAKKEYWKSELCP
jgi:hypothetical protein